jgi:putative FmdB family regulatory protein
MPIYDYRCKECGHEVEVRHGIDASGPETCAVCGGAMRKALTAPAIHFKGSGWAKKDAKAASNAKASSTAKGDAAAGNDKASDGAGDSEAKTAKGESGGDTGKADSSADGKGDSKAKPVTSTTDNTSTSAD